MDEQNINGTGFAPIIDGGNANKPPIQLLPTGTAPEPSFERSVCLRGKEGKCKHLWVLQTHFPHSNTVGTFKEGEEPRKIHRSCRLNPTEMDLGGAVVYACSEHSDPEVAEVAASFVFTDKSADPLTKEENNNG